MRASVQIAAVLVVLGGSDCKRSRGNGDAISDAAAALEYLVVGRGR